MSYKNEIKFLLNNPEIEISELDNTSDQFNLSNLKDLSQALNNTSAPDKLIEKLQASSESSQAGIVYYAMTKSKVEVDKLLNKQYSVGNEDCYHF